MGSFANGVFTLLLGWVSGVAGALWNMVSMEGGETIWQWIGRHWVFLLCLLCGVGVILDLVVYVFRWEPFRVWRTPWSRRARERLNDEEEEAEPEVRMPARREIPSEVRISEAERQPELTRWEAPAAEEPIEEPQPALVTPAGYRVPADSPYRRPPSQNEPNETGRMLGAAPVTRRRRRLNVATLFSDAEEDLMASQKPENIIDRRQAYHEPVYPRRWRENGEEDSE